MWPQAAFFFIFFLQKTNNSHVTAGFFLFFSSSVLQKLIDSRVSAGVFPLFFLFCKNKLTLMWLAALFNTLATWCHQATWPPLIISWTANHLMAWLSNYLIIISSCCWPGYALCFLQYCVPCTWSYNICTDWKCGASISHIFKISFPTSMIWISKNLLLTFWPWDGRGLISTVATTLEKGKSASIRLR